VIRYDIYMLAYIASDEIRLMTRAAVEQVLHTVGSDARVVLAFNGGEAFPLPAHERFEVVHWPEREDLGKAYNRIALAGRAPFVVFVHNDCFVPDDQPWLEKMAATAAAFGLAFPMVQENQEEQLMRGVTPAYDGCPPSCCYVVRRDVFGRLGGFDPIYQGCHFEDLDLFMRASQLGCTMARVKDVTVFHRRALTRATLVDESNVAFKRNAMIYQARWGGIDKLRVPGVRDVGLVDLLGGEVDANGLGTGETAASGRDETA